MPTVLIRSAAPTKMAFRRALPIRPSGLLKKPAGPQRCLFGVPDYQESIRMARNEIKVEQQRLSSKYNFDFENDVPLPGAYKYEKIDHSTEAIESRLREELLSAQKENKNAGASSSNSNSSSKNNVTTQKNLTDFYIVSRKRSCPFETAKPTKTMNTSTTTSSPGHTTRLTLAEICE